MEESILYPYSSVTRQVQEISGLWKFRFDEAGRGRELGYPSGLAEYELMPVPASYNELYTEKAKKEYAGDVWYSTDIFIPREWQGKDVLLRFGGVAHTAQVYVNGVSLGIHTGGFLPFECRLNEVVDFGSKACLVVCVNNELSEISLPVGRTGKRKDGTKKVFPNFDFFHYAGIHRHVKLMALSPDRVEDIDLRPSFQILNGHTVGYVDYEIKIKGNCEQAEVTVFDHLEQPVASCHGKRGKVTIQDAVLWDIYKGYLYKFQVRMLDQAGQCVDVYEQNIGIRTIEVEGIRLLLNHKEIYLKGFGKHEDAQISGRGYNGPVNKRDFELMKWCGANSFRTSHYPYSEEILQMADSEGFLVIGETAAVGMQDFEGNWLNPACESSKRYFGSELVKTQGLKNHAEHLKHMISRDKNHPCIIMWSLMNEPDCSDAGAREYYSAIFQTAKETDPEKRPCSFSNHTLVGRNCANWKFCDILLLNKYNGWYVDAGIDIDYSMEKLREELEGWRIAGKPAVISEFGADALTGLHELPAVQWSEEYQMEFLEKNGEVFDEFDFIVGEHIWNFADFQTSEALHRVDGNRKGIFTRDRQPKLAAHFVRKRWNLPS